jgi:triphosphatase
MAGSHLQKEIEVKLELPPASLPSIKRVPLLKALKVVRRSQVEVSMYFDTDKQKLRKHGLMLRVRNFGHRHIQTIKASRNFGPIERDEWEAEITGNEPDLNLAQHSPLRQLLSNKLRRQLKPVFKTRVQRTVYQVGSGARDIALMVDHGTINTGDRSRSLCEIELELMQRGSVVELFELARQLIRALPARLALKSKAERGYELIDGRLDTPVKSAAVDLSAKMTARGAFKVIGLGCLRQVLDNGPALIKGDPEGVHQMRVGLRRLRAVISLFGSLLCDPQTAVIQDELIWLTDELGPARELEVLMKRVTAPIKGQRMRETNSMRLFTREIARKREAAIVRAQTAVDSTRFATLTLEVAAWLQCGHWTTPQDDLIRDRGDLPITVFAADQLTRRWRKLRKKRKSFAQLDVRGRHRLRIQTKKLRYAVEFFGTLFTGKRALKRLEQLLPVLECLQDSLGDLNDIAVDEARLATMGIRRRSSRNQVFTAGVLTGREDARIEEAEAVATEAYAKLVKIKPFWL